MRLLLSSFFLICIFIGQLTAQVTSTLYYNDQGELTIPALSSHYRVAEFDSLTKEFDGISLPLPTRLELRIYLNKASDSLSQTGEGYQNLQEK
ncbi:MAG: hypothetical protein ABJG78_13185 [Cyclobacteriaceae bacterium]